jgi:hypothetical protein
MDWVAAIARLFADSNLCRELGAAGRHFVEEHHHWDRCLAPLLNVIDAPPDGTV